MSFNFSSRMLFEPQRTIGFAAIGVGYMGVGTAVNHPVRQFLIWNLTDANLQFSFDGVNDHFVIPESGFFLSDISSNRTEQSGAFYLSEGDRLYVKQLGVPTTGNVYFSVVYGKV